MSKCQRCKGSGRAIVLAKQKEGFYHTEQAVCPECGGKGYTEQTNEEWFCGLSTEEKAEWISKHMNCNFCPMQLKCEDMRDCKKHIEEWLKEKRE